MSRTVQADDATTMRRRKCVVRDCFEVIKRTRRRKVPRKTGVNVSCMPSVREALCSCS